MNDEELAGAILERLAGSKVPTRIEDIFEIGRDCGVGEHYQIQRVAMRLQEQGLIEDLGFSGQSLPARITGRGESSLESGDYRNLTERAVAELESHGRIAEARDREATKPGPSAGGPADR